jgi:hypothetical protein
MLRNALFIMLATTTAIACGSSSSTAADDSDLVATPAALIGHFQVVEDPNTLGGLWINDVTLQRNGSFNATFGSDVSNLSGHEFTARGTFSTHRFTAGPSVVFAYSGPDSPNSFTYAVQPDGTIKMRHLDSAVLMQTKFTLRKVR